MHVLELAGPRREFPGEEVGEQVVITPGWNSVESRDVGVAAAAAAVVATAGAAVTEQAFLVV